MSEVFQSRKREGGTMLAARSHATSSRQPHPHIHQVSRSYLVVKLGDPYASRRNHNIFDLVGHGFERLKRSRKQQKNGPIGIW